MSAPSPKAQAFVWGGLTVVILVIVVAFLRAKPTPRPLTVYSDVPDFTLTNQLGQAVTRGSLLGRVTVSDVIFTRCPSQCIKMTQLLGRIQRELTAADPIQIISLTTDPEFDQPAVLKRYATQYGADAQRWLFLTGEAAAIHHLASSGFKFVAAEKRSEERDSPEDLFIHTTKVVLVDKLGRIRGWYSTEEPDSEATILAAARQVAAEP